MSTEQTQPDERATSLFDLTRAQLRPVVENIAGEPVDSFDVRVECHPPGHRWQDMENRNSRGVVDVGFETQSGRKDTARVFVKRLPTPEELPEPDCREAHHYVGLAEHNAPVAKFYGAIRDSADREILFLEYLDTVREPRPYLEFMNNEEHMRQFLSVTAHLDTVKPTGEYAAKLPIWLPEENPTSKWLPGLQRVWQDAEAGKLGDEIGQFCANHSLDAFRAPEVRTALPTRADAEFAGHDCYEPGHVGWRPVTGEMVVFDLQAAELAPRFSHVSRYTCLGLPDEIIPRCRPQRELAGYYMDEYVRWGGNRVEIDEFFDEIRTQWLDEAVCLPNRWRGQIAEGRPGFHRILHALLRKLWEGTM